MNRLAQNGAGIFLATSSISMPPAALAMKMTQPVARSTKQPEIKFALDVQTLFDEQALDDAAAGPVCGVTSSCREFGWRDRRLRRKNAPVLRRLLAAATCVDLRFYDHDIDMRSQTVRRFARFFSGEDNFAAGSGHAIARQNRPSPGTRVIFIEVPFSVRLCNRLLVLEF